MQKTNNIRNFSIIAHIDHGKSTIADRILEYTKSISKRDMKNQFLDKMDIERERGITIKSQTVRLKYLSENNNNYVYNLIDTPGHIDFGHEVNRSLVACEGVLLVVDSTQGIQSQTIANLNLALEKNLKIIPIINKIDLPYSNIKKTTFEITNLLNIKKNNIILCSGKTGFGIKLLMEEIIRKIPPPKFRNTKKSKAIIFDSWFDNFKGVILLIRVFSGKIILGQKILLVNKQKEFTIKNIGVFTPKILQLKEISSGNIGFIVANIKKLKDAEVGETITSSSDPCKRKIKNFTKNKPIIFAGIFPSENINYNNLKNALTKLSLNDPSIKQENESNLMFGFGFRCGFSGILHMEIVKERLSREFGVDLIITAPSVTYKCFLKSRNIIYINNPSRIPDTNFIKYIEEPIAFVKIFTPKKFIGLIIKLCHSRRGQQKKISYRLNNKVLIEYLIPMSEIVLKFFDSLKTITSGYATFEYRDYKYIISKLLKIDILINKKNIDTLSIMTHQSVAFKRSRILCEKIKKSLSRQNYKIIIQAMIGGKIIARETISALRKDVTAKCYGGDVTRKKKLLEKQKKGKKNTKNKLNIKITQKTFLSVLDAI